MITKSPEPLLDASAAMVFRGCKSRTTLWKAIRSGEFPKPDVIIHDRRFWFPSTITEWQLGKFT